jgi:hypothetical protein
MIKGFILSVLLILLTMSAANAQSQAIDVAAAKKEGKVIVYGSVVPQAMKSCTKASRKSTTSRSSIGAAPPPQSRNAPKRSGVPVGPLSTWWSPAGTL